MHDPRLLRFVAIVGVCYAVWYGVYDLWLLPDGRVDAWLSAHVAGWTAGLLGAFGYPAVVRDATQVWIGETGIRLVAACNGLSVLSLFVGFVLAFPGRWSRRAWFIPLGLGVIVLTNVVRCAVLLGLLTRSRDAFDVGHGSGGLLLFYGVVFALWMLWARVGGSTPPPPPAEPPPVRPGVVAGLAA